MADLRIDLAAEFKGKKAFKQADSAVSSLDRAVGKLGKQVASVFAAQKILAFGKASVKAFAEDQASAARLTKTIDNLGLAFANPAITNFIQKLSMQSGIVDETLRPSFQALLTTTGDVTKSMDLLTKAVDISRGSGVDIATVVDDLSKGYVGITKGLEKYKLGLTRAQLKTMPFEQIMVRLNQQFKGASAAYLNTYAGKLDILTVAADNAKETIGKGLIDAFTSLAGEQQNIQDVADAIQNAADATANFIRGIGRLAGDLKNIPGLGAVVKLLELSVKYSPAGLVAKLGEKKPSFATALPSTLSDFQYQQETKAAQDAKKRADAQAKLLKEQLNNQKKLTAEQKKQAALKKDAGIFDLQQIQLIAALKGDLSADDRKRAELQLALLNNNLTEADKLTKQILMAQDATGNLYRYFMQTPDAKNPFAYLDKWIADFQTKLNSLQMPNLNVLASNPTATGYGIGGTTISPTISSNSVIQGAFDSVQSQLLATGSTAAQAAAGALDAARWTAALDQYSAQTSGGYVGGGVSQMGQNGAVVVQIDGKTIATANQSQSLSGIPSNVSRVNGMFTG